MKIWYSEGNQHNISQTLVRPIETPDVSSKAVAQAFQDNLSLAEKTQDWGGYISAINNAEQGGILSNSKANELRYDGEQKQLGSQLEHDILENPQKAMLSIVRGQYDNMAANIRSRMTKACEQALSLDCKQLAFTQEERQKIEQGLSVKPKYDVRNGATEQEHKGRNHFNTYGTYGTYDTIKDEIKVGWKEEIQNAPVPENQQDADQWVKRMVKKY